MRKIITGVAVGVLALVLTSTVDAYPARVEVVTQKVVTVTTKVVERVGPRYVRPVHEVRRDWDHRYHR